ncbi:uncharacterized protein [Nicotiana tomentosiformis]|uniref:uncharacterized protein n=1 Tax=Nicotiana tomentosiformis TaxID=4098 RepID=UPI00388CAD2C
MVDDGLKKKGETRAQKKKKDGNLMNEETDEKVLSQIPAYAKFLKEILPNNRKLEDTSVVKLSEHCSAILRNKLPQKYRDPRSYTIPCSLGSTKFEKYLCESAADQTTIIPEGIVEDVLVQVDKFVFSVDFIVVNMEENWEVPPILGRSFLATGKSLLDIQERQLMLRVGEERLVFKMEEAMGASRDKLMAYSDSKVDVLKEQVGQRNDSELLR